jgi:hypothetical protein
VLSRQEEEAERIETLLQDAELRQREQRQKQQREGSTFLEQYHSDIGGRFSVTQTEIVTGRASPQLPPLPACSPWSSAQPEPGLEPPLGYAIHQVEPSASFPAAEVTGAPAAAVAPPSALLPTSGNDGVEPGAGAPPSSEQITNK